MTWQLNVDQQTCMGTGMCAGMAPDLFELDDRTAKPIKPDIEPAEQALDAADQCPTQAITVLEGGKEIGPRP